MIISTFYMLIGHLDNLVWEAVNRFLTVRDKSNEKGIVERLNSCFTIYNIVKSRSFLGVHWKD